MPTGVDIGIWKQAIADNPDPENMIPVPMVGFEDLETRIDNQNRQAAAHESRLEVRWRGQESRVARWECKGYGP